MNDIGKNPITEADWERVSKSIPAEKPMADQFYDKFGGIKNILLFIKKGKKGFDPEEMIKEVSRNILELQARVNQGDFDELFKDEKIKDEYDKLRMEYENRARTQKHKPPKKYIALSSIRRSELLLKEKVADPEEADASEKLSHLLGNTVLQAKSNIDYLERTSQPQEDPIVLVLLSQKLIGRYDKEKAKFNQFNLITVELENDVNYDRDRLLNLKWEKIMKDKEVFNKYESAQDTWANNIESLKLLKIIKDESKTKSKLSNILTAVKINISNLEALKKQTEHIFWDEEKEKQYQEMKQLCSEIVQKNQPELEQNKFII